MFHHVREINLIALDSGLRQSLVEELARRPHEGFAREVFVVSGLLADKDDFGAGRTFAKDGLCPSPPQWARPTTRGEPAKLFQRCLGRNPRGGNRVTGMNWHGLIVTRLNQGWPRYGFVERGGKDTESQVGKGEHQAEQPNCHNRPPRRPSPGGAGYDDIGPCQNQVHSQATFDRRRPIQSRGNRARSAGTPPSSRTSSSGRYKFEEEPQAEPPAFEDNSRPSDLFRSNEAIAAPAALAQWRS
jgi:hypothetical protein